MSLARPLVGVYDANEPNRPKGSILLPTVMQAPVRPDLVNFVHHQLLNNRRIPHGTKPGAGYQTSAESWGTGRAVARIPRVPGGGTHRAGQGAFGNMCRGGGMFSPLKVWRRWNRKVNLTQRRHAVASSIAGSCFPALVMGRGHKIDDVPEVPLVVSNDIQKFKKTKQAVAFLKKFGKRNFGASGLRAAIKLSFSGVAFVTDHDNHLFLGLQKELDRTINSRKIRAGKGKMRNRRYVNRKGPLIVYSEDEGVSKAFANIIGIDTGCVTRLNLLNLAPGGHIGRFIIWTEAAFGHLQQLYGTYESGSPVKSGYVMHRPIMTNADLCRIINSAEIQSAIRPQKEAPPRVGKNRNPLRNHSVMCRLNPAHKVLKHQRRCMTVEGTKMHQRIQSLKAERKKAKAEFRKKGKRMLRVLKKLSK